MIQQTACLILVPTVGAVDTTRCTGGTGGIGNAIAGNSARSRGMPGVATVREWNATTSAVGLWHQRYVCDAGGKLLLAIFAKPTASAKLGESSAGVTIDLDSNCAANCHSYYASGAGAGSAGNAQLQKYAVTSISRSAHLDWGAVSCRRCIAGKVGCTAVLYQFAGRLCLSPNR